MRGRERRLDGDLHATQVFVDGFVTCSVEACSYVMVLDITNNLFVVEPYIMQCK